ncbi:I78 family peptidase inhibitor [Rhizobium sp. ZK1]|uniref:I78 family peptidase inhibitor n=1 Tax=Rhizobium sp. ZK1 TaxID=3389872 RepID=UPI0039F658FC
MSGIWVYKQDGTIFCVPAKETEITLSKMRKELEALIGAKNVLAEEKRGPPGKVIEVCGHPTGNVNAYQITQEGLYLLFSGIAGPSGFNVDPNTQIMMEPADHPIFPWPTENKGRRSGDDRWVPWPWAAIATTEPDAGARAFINVISALTQSGSAPTQIAELIGRRCRIYNEGDMITMDYVPQRVNVVLEAGRISRIWFG